jgi:hypothetical protein
MRADFEERFQAYCAGCQRIFVALVLKADSWKRPAWHACGNVFDEWNGLKWIGL